MPAGNKIAEQTLEVKSMVNRLSSALDPVFMSQGLSFRKISDDEGVEKPIKHSTVYLLLVAGENFNEMKHWFDDPKIDRADVLYRIGEDLYKFGVIAQFNTIYDWKSKRGRPEIIRRIYSRTKATKYIPIPPDILLRFYGDEEEIRSHAEELEYMSNLYTRNYSNHGLTIDRGIIFFECQRDWEIYMTTYWLLSGRVRESVRIKTRRGTWYKKHKLFRDALVETLKRGIEIKVIANITSDLIEEAEAFEALGGHVKHMDEGSLGIDRLIIMDDDLAVYSHRITRYNEPIGIYAGTIFVKASEQINNLIKKFEYEFA